MGSRNFSVNSYMNLTLGIILANLAVFFLGYLKADTLILLLFSPGLVDAQGYWWQFFTFPYVHKDFFPILFNIMALFFFAFTVEERMGSIDFVIFYHLSSWLPGLAAYGAVKFLGFPNGYFFGADASIYAVLLAFAVFYPREEIYLFGIVPIRSGVLVLFYVGITIFFQIFNQGMANLVLLGGLMVSGIYLGIRYRVNPIQKLIDSIRS